MKLLLLLTIAFLTLNLQPIIAANILAVFQNPTPSHGLYQAHLMRALAARGHSLTIFTAQLIDDLKSHSNVVQHHFDKSAQIHRSTTDPLSCKQRKLHWLETALSGSHETFYETTMQEIAHPEMQKLLHESYKYSFDVLIIECYYCHLVALADIYDCPIVTSTPPESFFMLHGLMGNDISPALFPEPSSLPYLNRHLTFAERIESLLFTAFYLTVGAWKMNGFYGSKINEKFFPARPVDVRDVYQRRAALLLTNTNAAFGHVRPLMPNTVQVGFMHIEPPKAIEDQKLLTFLDKSPNGVIVFNFGSVVDMKNLEKETVVRFMTVFNQTNLNVVWKSQQNELQASENFYFCDWLPLADVLAHQNVKVLISHSGLLSAYEAIDRLVPMIVFPVGYDTGANARMLVHNGVAVELDLNSFTEDELLSAFNEVQSDEFKNNLRRLRQRVYDQPIASRELAVWHIESVIRNGNDLKVETSGYEEQFKRYFVDVIALTLGASVGLWWYIRKVTNRVNKVSAIQLN